MARSNSTAGSMRMWLPVDQLLSVPDTHQNHPQLLHIDAADPRNHRRYHYLSWQVMHPPTTVAWDNSYWYEFHHSLAAGQPYHEGHQIEVYPMPTYPEIQRMNQLPLLTYKSEAHQQLLRQVAQEAHTEKGTTIRHNTYGGSTTSTQTLVTTTEVISCTIVPGGDDEPPPSTQHQNPQHIRDMFDITL